MAIQQLDVHIDGVDYKITQFLPTSVGRIPELSFTIRLFLIFATWNQSACAGAIKPMVQIVPIYKASPKFFFKRPADFVCSFVIVTLLYLSLINYWFFF